MSNIKRMMLNPFLFVTLKIAPKWFDNLAMLLSDLLLLFPLNFVHGHAVITLTLSHTHIHTHTHTHTTLICLYDTEIDTYTHRL